jgi:hypothetical protein
MKNEPKGQVILVEDELLWLDRLSDLMSGAAADPLQ